MQTPISPANPAPSEAPTNASSGQTTGQSVARATAGIGALHLVRFVIGFIAQPLIAHNLGLRWQADAYAVSTDIVQRLWLIFEKVINPAFLPNFIAAMKDEGEERAWKLASTAVWLIAGALLVVAPLAWFAMPTLVHLLAQKQPPQAIDLTIRAARTLLLGLFFLGFSSLTYTILNGYRRFVYAALGDAFWKLGVFAGAGTAYALYGKQLGTLAKGAKAGTLSAAQNTILLDLAEKSLWLIVWGFVIGSLLKLVPHLFAIGKKWRFLKPQIDLKDPLTRKMFALAVPLLLGILVSETRGFYLQYLADDPSTKIEAGRAALKWSRIIGDNLIQIFPYALSIGIFPFLADLAREKDRQPLTDTLLGALRICVFTFVPLTAILIALRFPLLRAVWESGRLTQADTIVMSWPFMAFTLGLVAFACEMMLSQTFYAMTRAWIPTLIGLATSVLWIILAKTGVEGLGWGLAAIAGAESISKTVKCIVMWQMLKPHLGDVKRRENFFFALKVLAGAIAGALCAAFLIRFIAPDDTANHFKLKMLIAVSVAGIGGLSAFLGASFLLKIEETRALNKVLRRLTGKFSAR
ncbi:murein biosynthesis integral membrane protein MurJ [Abditibacterium utsteinense]|uniref:Murein biosynthesis integral membrane protein MurJ n=1 Tax=Abditibacterium utsteinense TaxID=1960156 RepID=A0A2S8SUV0_9BACT|nr:lipid II flippase MurJ [Abditibacterium utsteinense]PQV64549.1 murein biosynthesis integral membrane protein MurJ [Abditibacterium utsteinense]